MSERLRSIVEQLDIRPADRVLEIFAVRVGLFHRDPEGARRIAQSWLAPGGSVFAFFDPPPGRSP